jgi:hypothetical protein
MASIVSNAFFVKKVPSWYPRNGFSSSKTRTMKWSYYYITLTVSTAIMLLLLGCCVLQQTLPVNFGIPTGLAKIGSGLIGILLVSIGTVHCLARLGKLNTEPHELDCIRNGSFLVYHEPANHIAEGSYHWFSDPLDEKRRFILAVEGSFVAGTVYQKTSAGLILYHKTPAQLYISLIYQNRPGVVDI